MRRLLIVLIAATVLFVASPAMAHRHRHWYGGYGGWGGYGYRPYTSFYGGYYPPTYSYPVYPYYGAPAYGYGYGYGMPYPYYNNYYFGFGGAY